MLRIYTTATCGYCHRAKDFMHRNGVPFEEVRVDQDPVAGQQMVHMTGQMGVPVIANHKHYVIGFDPDGILALAAET